MKRSAQQASWMVGLLLPIGCQPLDRPYADPLDSGEAATRLLDPARTPPADFHERQHRDRVIDRYLDGAPSGSEIRGVVGADVRGDF